ncbi:hypothetical protein HGRIS_010858 [Hohenbuehelia grisea]|uniref:Amidohydrolase-related domain-containing protein n=1 Tax=Hohenbuehelia grisea TaxID=104357 RepID=A0ABR3IY31_9AGAR
MLTTTSNPTEAIPYEIWVVVLEIVLFDGSSPYDPWKSAMMQVNRTFFRVVTELLHREVRWAVLDNQMVRSLLTLRNPSIAARVRKLSISASFTRTLPKSDSFRFILPHNLRNQWDQAQSSLFNRHASSGSMELILRPEVLRSFKAQVERSTDKEAFDIMGQAVAGMTGVTEFIFEFDGRASVSSSFLSTAWEAFGQHLRRLSLRLHAGTLEHFLRSAQFLQLDEMNLTFDTYAFRTDEPQSGQRSVSSLGPSLLCSIKCLRISSYATADLSGFFQNIGAFTHLQSLFLHLGFRPDHLDPSSSIIRFINAHADTLHSIGLTLPADSYEDAESRITYWASGSITLVPFRLSLSCLREFSYSLCIPVHMADIVAFVRCSASTLQTLRLSGCFLTHAEVCSILDIFNALPLPSRLITLSLPIGQFGAHFMDLFAEIFPYLESLELVIESVGRFNPATRVFHQTALPVRRATTPPVGETADELRANLLDIHNQRLDRMNTNNVDFMVLSCASPCVQGISDPIAAAEMAQTVNNQLAADISNNTARFGAFATLAMHNATEAAQELKRTIQELGFLGALLNDYQQSGPDTTTLLFYDTPDYDPFWQMVTDLDVPVYLHPRTNIAQIGNLAYAHAPFLRGPAQEFAATLSTHILGLCTNGVFDRFPKLKVIVGHLGERIPSDLVRIDNQLKRQIAANMPMKLNVTAYWKTNLFETTSGNFATDLLKFHIDQIGLDRILYSVDYPYVAIEDGTEWVDGLERTARMNARDVLALKRGNAIILLGLDK